MNLPDRAVLQRSFSSEPGPETSAMNHSKYGANQRRIVQRQESASLPRLILADSVAAPLGPELQKREQDRLRSKVQASDTALSQQRPGRAIRRARYAQRRIGRPQLPPMRLPSVPADFDTSEIRIAVVVHVGNATLWPELERHLDNLIGDYCLFVTLLRLGGNAPVLRARIQARFPGAHVMVVDNIGMDVGAFLLVLDHFKQQRLSFDYILKLHTKSDANWRNELINPLLASQEHVRRLLYFFHGNPDIGMAGSRRRIYTSMGPNKHYVEEYLQRIRRTEQEWAPRRVASSTGPLNWRISSQQFVGGTIFLARYDIFERLLRNVDLKEWYRELPPGRVHDIVEGQRPHALERLFGCMVALTGHKLAGV